MTLAPILCVALMLQAPNPPNVSGLTIAIRPTDLDSKGHVNNAKYLEYLQAARWRWLEDHLLTDESLQAEGVVMVVVRIEIDYRAQIRYGDGDIKVETLVSRDGEKKLVFDQRIRNVHGAFAAEAKVIMVAIDPIAGRSRALPKSLGDLLRDCDTPRR